MAKLTPKTTKIGRIYTYKKVIVKKTTLEWEIGKKLLDKNCRKFNNDSVVYPQNFNIRPLNTRKSTLKKTKKFWPFFIHNSFKKPYFDKSQEIIIVEQFVADKMAQRKVKNSAWLRF